MRVKTKGVFTAVLFAVLLGLSAVLFIFAPHGAITASAATTTSNVCTIKGRVQNTGGSLSTVDISENFTVTMESSTASGTATLEQNVKLSWTYIIIKANVNSIKGHKSFTLLKDGNEYQKNTLSGTDSITLFSGNLPDGNYSMYYQFSVKKGVTLYPALDYVFNFSIDTTAPQYALKAGGISISSGSSTNKYISYTASDTNFRYIYYKKPNASSYSTTTNTTYNVDATAANTGWWEFYATDTLGQA
ncbi:MAG: hypothetical protein NC131_17115, partial [Roseburia sp.]|nr:hypothetical protein [Roseburia sp.]